jgi:hypothetical protein
MGLVYILFRTRVSIPFGFVLTHASPDDDKAATFSQVHMTAHCVYSIALRLSFTLRPYMPPL